MRQLLFIVPLLLTLATPTRAANLPVKFDLPDIDAFVEGQLHQLGLAGLSIAIVRDGKIILAKGYGHRSIEKSQPVNTNTLFAIGSITKQFTCACILLLAEEGKLSVNDKVGKYFPNLTEANRITLLDLMQNVSGYPDYYPLDFVDRRMASPISIDELIRQYAGGKLDFEPGTRWSYSNTGFVILGRIIEKVTGQSFQQFLQQRILDPLGMNHTAFGFSVPNCEFAQGYSSFALGPLEPAMPEADGWIFSAGAIYSTASDLALWDLALIQGKVLKPDSFKILTTPRQLTDGKLTTYGCGLGISLREGFTVLSHNGAVSGFTARNAVIPACQSAIVLLSNTEKGSAFAKLHSQLISLLLQTPTPVPKVAGKSALEAAKDFFQRLQAGKVDRRQLGEDFSLFLDERKLRGTAHRLKLYGSPKTVMVQEVRERGAMEVSTIRFAFKSRSLSALMYRTTDGKIQEFFVEQE